MTATPANMVSQIRTAQRVNPSPRVRPVFTSETGVQRPSRSPRPGVVAPVVVIEDDPHCFVCGRHTDHYAEHDDMVEKGTARYGEDGSVYPVPWHWDD